MKLKIETKPNGAVAIQLTTDTAKKPMTHVFTKPQVETLISLLSVAMNSAAFSFSFEND